MHKSIEKYQEEVCTHCNQTITYMLRLDKGSAKIMKAMIEGVSKKGKNLIHPAKELDLDLYGDEKWFLSNLSRPRFHGLIAYADEEKLKGYYVITRKGGKFLRGEPVPRYAIINKSTGHQQGYWHPEETVTIKELLSEEIMWDGEQKQMLTTIAPDESDGQLALGVSWGYAPRNPKRYH